MLHMLNISNEEIIEELIENYLMIKNLMRFQDELNILNRIKKFLLINKLNLLGISRLQSISLIKILF